MNIADWTPVELAVLKGCLRVRYFAMLHDAAVNENWDGNECREMGKALERLKDAEAR